MGKTQAELAQLLHRDTQSVGRWEREENVPDPIHDMIIRQYVAESLGLELSRTLKEQSQRVISVVQKPPIRIEIGEDRQAPYRLIA